MKTSTHAITEYFDALARLQTGRPLRVPKGTKISNDAVALEAGRGKGSIKKSRPAFVGLIQAINDSVAKQSTPSIEQKQNARFDRVKAEALRNRKDLDAATASLVSRLYEIHELKKKIRTLENDVQLLTERLSLVSNSKVRPISSKPSS